MGGNPAVTGGMGAVIKCHALTHRVTAPASALDVKKMECNAGGAIAQ